MRNVPVAVAGLLAVALAIVVLPTPDLPWWVRVGVVLAPTVAATLLDRSPEASLLLCALAAVPTALGVGNAVPPWAVAFPAALAVVAFLAGKRISRLGPVLVAFAAGALLAVALVLVADDAWATGLPILAVAVVFPWNIGRVIRQQAELAASEVERTQLRERTRIANDVHDTLGHELSLLTLRAGSLELASDLSDEHRARAAELRAGAGAATERLSDLIRVLRGDEPAPLAPQDESVEELVAEAARSGMAVDLVWDGDRALPATVAATARQVVRETLTNAAKHAPGAAVHVRLRVTNGTTTVSVTSTKRGRRRGPGTRTGLAALRERVRLAGGTLRFGRLDQGFEVVATLPHPEKT